MHNNIKEIINNIIERYKGVGKNLSAREYALYSIAEMLLLAGITELLIGVHVSFANPPSHQVANFLVLHLVVYLLLILVRLMHLGIYYAIKSPYQRHDEYDFTVNTMMLNILIVYIQVVFILLGGLKVSALIITILTTIYASKKIKTIQLKNSIG